MDLEHIHERECRFSDLVGEISKSMEMNHEFYDKYANKYDDMMKSMGFKIPGHLARLCMENLSDNSKANLAKLTALDVASGTGLAAEALKEAGFCGVIDAIDASLQMNEVAKSKNIYRKILCHMITVDSRMPFLDNTYDVVVACSALTPGHIKHACLNDFLRVVKPGGIMIFNVSHLTTVDPDGECVQCAKCVLDKMHDEGKCECVSETHTDMFKSDMKYHKFKETVIHCFIKN